MFKRITLLLSLTVTLAVSSAVGAQTTAPDFDPAEAEGLVSGYGRVYIADVEAILATPEAAMDLDFETIALSGLAMVMTFEDEDAASNVFEDSADEFAEGFMEDSDTGADPTEIDDLGDQAVEFFGETEVDETTTSPSSMIIVQESEYIYVAMILGGTDVSESTRAFTEYLPESEIPDTEVEFNADGTSTGGVYDIMPNAENSEIVHGMIPFMDMEFLGEDADDTTSSTADSSTSSSRTSSDTSSGSVKTSSSDSGLEIGNITSKDAGIGDGSIYVYVEVTNNTSRLYSYVGLEGACYNSSGSVIGTGLGNSANVAPGETVVVTMIFLSVPGCDSVQVRFDSLTGLQ